MRQITTIEEMHNEARALMRAEKKHGFVPTMGNLHRGHLSLMQAARAECECVTVSIFVNPAQFNNENDLTNYPRTLERDLELCHDAEVDFVFTPSAEELYLPNRDVVIIPNHLSNHLCGITRGRGHFIGVCTIVAKLFNLVMPNVAYFGQKDAQQALIIQRMIRDLNFPIKMALLPTVRENDGLALSSRNNLLTPPQRKNAPILYQALQLGAQMISAGEKNSTNIINKITEKIIAHDNNDHGAEIDYLEIVDSETLSTVETINDLVLIAGAVKFGEVRLIDNILASRG